MIPSLKNITIFPKKSANSSFESKILLAALLPQPNQPVPPFNSGSNFSPTTSATSAIFVIAVAIAVNTFAASVILCVTPSSFLNSFFNISITSSLMNFAIVRTRFANGFLDLSIFSITLSPHGHQLALLRSGTSLSPITSDAVPIADIVSAIAVNTTAASLML